jgi:hypothetical protein
MSLLLLLTLLGAIDGETGTLRIHSQPGSEVLWEGVSLGNTDTDGFLTVSDIPPGTFTLVLRKIGFREFQTSVSIAAGKTVSLEARLQPPRPPAVTRPSRDRVPTIERAEPAGSDQDKRLNEVLNAPPKPGPLPVWSAASRPAPQEGATGIPIWPFALGGTLLVLVFWLSRKLRPVGFPRSPALLAETDVLPPPHTPERTAAFLSDLKKREELLEQGVEIEPNRAKGPVIDLDSGSVREVEEK